ncbi:unnamed protein product [Heligmosomoides polygyrus]|uniref:LisH domain-containing protein n=1 Tax=Heligmosomoides polygyrus TaxID=6339 RepID=A0A183GX66_HELPZ|nr:unnamed protein product [Heligmosomoides polygyrus]
MEMDPRLMNNDLGYVYKYMKAKNQTASGFENDLEMTLHALHQQADVAATLRSDWQHLRRDEVFLLEAPGEQVLLLNRCLRTGELTKEKMIKLATRYLLTERMFEQQVENGKLNSTHLHTWYNKPHKFNVKSDYVFQFAYDNLSQLKELINELEREKRRAERDFHRSKTTYYHEQEGRQLLHILRNDMSKDEQRFQNEIGQLRNKLKDQELELKRMQDTINSLKEQTTPNISNNGIEVTVNLSKKTDRTAIVESPMPDLVSDDEYFDRMLDEVQGNNIGSESKGNIINKSLFLWYNWRLFLQSKGN